MAILAAKFEADFSSFQTAVQKAEVQLKGMETGAGKVEKSLNRMVDGFSGRKLIQDALLAAEAVERIGGTSKLTQSELTTLGAKASEAVAKMRALGQDVPAGIQKIADAAKQSTSVFGDLTSQVKATALGFISAQAIIGGVQTAFRALSAFIGSSVDSFAAAESAQKKLTVALQASGFATPTVIKQLDALATQFQKTTVYSDDLITEMQALLTQVGTVAPSQMGKALKASTDLASGLGIDLHAATLLVAKAFSGGGDELGRLKAILGDTIPVGEGMAGVMDAIQKKFGGQAAGEVDTYAGKIKQMANEWDNFKETVGKAIVLDPTVIAVLNLLTKGASGAGGLSGGLATFVGAGMGQSAGDVVRLLGFYTASINKADQAAKDAVALVKLPEVIADGWKNALPPTIAQQVSAIAKAYKPLTDEQKKSADSALKHAEALRQLNARFADAQRALVPLTSTQAQLVTQYLSMNLSVSDIAAKMHLGTREVKQWADGVAAMNRVTAQQIPLIRTSGDALKFTADGMLPLIHNLKMFPTSLPFLEKNIFAALPKPINDATDSVYQLARSFQQLASIGGGSMGTVIGSLGDMLGGIDSIRKATEDYGKIANRTFTDTTAYAANMGTSVFGMFTTMVSIVDGWGAASERAAKQAGDAMRAAFKDALELAGGYAELQKRIEGLGYSWGTLSASFNRSRGDAEAIGTAVKRAGTSIQDFNAAFANTPQGMTEASYKTQAQLQTIADKAKAVWAYMVESGQYTAASIAAAFQASKDAQVSALGETASAASKAIADMNTQLISLQQSVANEAPEAIMGVIEAQTRAQIAAIVTQRDEAQLALDQTVGDAAKAAEEAATAIKGVLAGHDFRVKVHFDYDGLPSGLSLPSSGSGQGLVTPQAAAALVSTGGGSSASSPPDVQVTLVMPDGEVLAKQLVRTLKRAGLR